MRICVTKLDYSTIDDLDIGQLHSGADWTVKRYKEGYGLTTHGGEFDFENLSDLLNFLEELSE